MIYPPAPPYIRHPLCTVSSDQVTTALEQAIEQAGHLVGIKGVVATSRGDYQAVCSEADMLPAGGCGLSHLRQDSLRDNTGRATLIA